MNTFKIEVERSFGGGFKFKIELGAATLLILWLLDKLGMF